MTQQRKASGPDLIGDFQRWLARSSARGMSRGLGGQIRDTLGMRRGDVWERATTTSPDEDPECPWCPHCRARRMLRESGPGVTSRAAAAGGVVASVISDAVSVFEAALASTGSRPQEGGGPARGPEATAGQGSPDDQAHSGPPDGQAHSGPPEGSPHEPDDRG